MLLLCHSVMSTIDQLIDLSGRRRVSINLRLFQIDLVVCVLNLLRLKILVLASN